MNKTAEENRVPFLRVVLSSIMCGVFAIGQANAEAGKVSVIHAHEEPKNIPDYEFYSPSGQVKTLSQLEGQPIVLNLWATWCAPCREEMPSLDRLAELTPDLQVIAVSQDRAAIVKVPAFFDKYDIDSLDPFYESSERAKKELRLKVFPTTILIDRKGKEVARYIGELEWDAPIVVEDIKFLLDVHD